MKVDITDKKENKLLSRVQVAGTVAFEGATPSRHDVLKAIASSMKAKEECVVVRSLKTRYGSSSADVIANVYDDRAALERVERSYMQDRNKAPEKPAEEPSEETPAKEDAPEESKDDEESKEETPAKEDAPEKSSAESEDDAEPKEESGSQEPQSSESEDESSDEEKKE